MNILGISCFYHDSAACLVRGDRVVAAAQEERFTRKKHDESFPANAVAYCLREGGTPPRTSIWSASTRSRWSNSSVCSKPTSPARRADSGRT